MGTESASREETAPHADAGPSSPTGRSAPRVALLAFVAVEAVAVPLLLFWGRHGWFTQDDWDFLSARTVGDAGDLFRSHFQHWTTLPILPYRLLWVMVGIRSYVPYQALVVVLHLTAAALLLVLMRRAGVHPWLATAAAVVFVFFGSGAENILVAFQITFVGALVLGLTQLLLADHDGPLGRRDGLGLLAGLAGLMCSGVAITLVVVVGLAVLLRRGVRGWRVALFHTAPLAAAYLLWRALAPEGQPAGNYRSQSVSQVARFVWIGVEAGFARLGQVPGVGVVLGAVLVVGTAVWLRAPGPRAALTRYAAPVALLVGAVVFLVVAGTVRAGQIALLGPERARLSRYVYVVAAMALPALALGADAIVRRWRPLTIPVVIALLLGLPGNIRRLATPERYFANAEATRAEIIGLPWLPLAGQLRGSHLLVPIQYPRFAQEGLTFGWLVDGADSGRVPDPRPISPVVAATWTLQNFLVPSRAGAPASHCEPVGANTIRVLEKGRKLTVERGDVNIDYVPVGSAPSFRPLRVESSKAPTVVALAGPLRLRIRSASKGVSVCD